MRRGLRTVQLVVVYVKCISLRTQRYIAERGERMVCCFLLKQGSQNLL